MKNLIASIVAALSIACVSSAHAQISISVGVAPPEIPMYVQPPIPNDGYLWIPGYWAWSDDDQDYFWVPGTWVLAPFTGALWTPGYWGWENGYYVWHNGYWGTQIGYYGGINYGYGYAGRGYIGGRWSNGVFAYNQNVNNISNVGVMNAYRGPVMDNTNRVSFNGGAGGIALRPSREEIAFARAPHQGPTAAQVNLERSAHMTPDLHTARNRGMPSVPAVANPQKFNAPNPGAYSGRPMSTPAAPTRDDGYRQQQGFEPKAEAPRMQQPAPEPNMRQPVQQMQPQERPQPMQQQERRPGAEQQSQQAQPHPKAAPRPEEEKGEHERQER